MVTDPDSLNLAVPTMAHLLSTCHSPVTVHDQDGNQATCDVAGPGALLAGKIATLGAEDRRHEKRYSDADDALRLLSTIPASRIQNDFRHMTTAERAAYNRIGYEAHEKDQTSRRMVNPNHPDNNHPPGLIPWYILRYILGEGSACH